MSRELVQMAEALALNEDPENDLLPLLPQELQEQLLLIYQNLSRDDLLQKCLGDHTQNANENFKSTIWQLSPKHLHSRLQIVKIFLHTSLLGYLMKAKHLILELCIV